MYKFKIYIKSSGVVIYPDTITFDNNTGKPISWIHNLFGDLKIDTFDFVEDNHVLLPYIYSMDGYDIYEGDVIETRIGLLKVDSSGAYDEFSHYSLDELGNVCVYGVNPRSIDISDRSYNSEDHHCFDYLKNSGVRVKYADRVIVL